MANVKYLSGRTGIGSGTILLLTDTIKFQPINTANYTVNATSHTSLVDIPTSARKGTAGTLANKTVSNGVFDADDLSISGINADEVDAGVFYKSTGVEATSTLIAYVDTAVSGLPTGALSNNTVTFAWSNGSSKIFEV